MIERLGAEVLVVGADVTDRASMKDALELSRKRFGAIHCVIHAAGVGGGGMMQLRTAEECDRVFAPKVGGTQILGELLKDSPPELLVLCSSIEAMLGNFGQAHYCAANGFLDAFAHANTHDNGVPTVSLNYDRWRETGKAAAHRLTAWEAQ